jgi:hypothetical protein
MRNKMNEEITLCVHCGDEILIIPDSSGRLLKCDLIETHIITKSGDLHLGHRHHSVTCAQNLKNEKAVNNGSA